MSPLILVTTEVRPMDGYVWHAAADTYLKARRRHRRARRCSCRASATRSTSRRCWRASTACS